MQSRLESVPSTHDSIVGVVSHADLPSLEAEAERIIASKPFNRLNGLYQFSINYTDPRLTNRYRHSVYVAEVGREICRRLGLSAASGQLSYNIGLIHDIGHPPFSHWGEASIKEHLGQDELLWNHDTAGLQCVTAWAPEIMISSYSLEGLAKRYWRYAESEEVSATNHSRRELPHDTITRASELHLDELNHLEGQIAAQADRIGFNATDIQDGLMIGRLTPTMLQAHFPSAYGVYEKLLNEFIKEYKSTNNLVDSEPRIKRAIINTPALHAIVFSRFTDAFREYQINDLVTQTKQLLTARQITSARDVRAQQQLTADFSEGLKTDFHSFEKFCRESIFAKSTKPFKVFVDAAVQHFLKNAVAMSEPYGARLHDAISHADKILVIAEYMTREMSDLDIVLQVLQYSPEIYHKHFPGYEIVKHEQVPAKTTEDYLHNAIEKQEYDLAQAGQTAEYLAAQTNHVVALPVEANIVIVGAAKKELDVLIALVKRYKITDKKLVINIVSASIHQDVDYENLLRSIEQKSLPIEINFIQNSVFSIIESPGKPAVVLSNLMTLHCDYVIYEEAHPAQRAVAIIADIHSKKNKPSKTFDRPLPAEENVYAKEYIATDRTSDPRFPNTNQVLPSWVQYGAGATTDGDRLYTAERLALHEVIIQKALLWNPVTKSHVEKTADTESQPTFHVISGGMSVGMTYMQRLMIYEKVIKPEHSVIITPLSFLDMPEFLARSHYQHPEKSPLLVEEYYDIAKKIAEAAMARGLNVVFVDQADDRDAILTMLDDAKKHSYTSSIVGMTMSPEAYHAASQLWLTKFNRIPDHLRGFGDLREFSENWPYYSQFFDLATLVETYFHVNDIDKSEDDSTRKEYEVEVLFSAHYNKEGYRVEKVNSPERYSMFLDRARYIQPSANSLDSANKLYPYPQFTRQLDTAKRGNKPLKLISEVAAAPVEPMKVIRRFFKNELELKFKEMVRKTTEQRAQVRQEKLDQTNYKS